MAEKIKIAFDLDGVIIDKPPLIPKRLLEWFFRGNRANKKDLHYRFPRLKLEQLIRKISHIYFFRPPISQNLYFLLNLAKNPQYELYIVSGRYSFIEKETYSWLKKRKIDQLFKKVFLNLNDRQPHLFKEETLKKIKADFFVDDDELLTGFLTKQLKDKKIYCYSPKGAKYKEVKTIQRLEEMFQ